MGQRANEVWSEIWPDIGPLIDTVLATGKATYHEGLLLLLQRSGFPEETYHTFSCSPLSDNSGRISGMLCVVTGKTDRLIGERRMTGARRATQPEPEGPAVHAHLQFDQFDQRGAAYLDISSGPSAMAQAIENPTPDLIAAMRGNTSEGEVLSNFKDALQNVKDARSAQYQAQLAQLPTNITLDPAPIWQRFDDMLGKFSIAKTSPVTTQQVVTSPVLDAGGQPISSTVQNTAPATLDFSRSTVTDRLAQKQIQSVYSDLMDWGNQPGDASPQGMDVLKRRIGNMYWEDSQASALIASVRDSAASVLKQNVPGYANMTAGYETASKFIDSLGDLSIDSKNPGTAIRKLTTTLHQNTDYRSMLTDALSQYSGVDLKGQLAGLAISKSGPQGSGASA